MNEASADKQRGWRLSREQNVLALEIVLLERTYILPWSQFLYAEGGDDQVRLVFATHDVIAKGAGLGALLSEMTTQRLTGLDEPSRADRIVHRDGEGIRELSVHRVGEDRDVR